MQLIGRFAIVLSLFTSACMVGDAPTARTGDKPSYPAGHPCAAEPDGEACYCNQQPDDPWCQNGGPTEQPGGSGDPNDPCTADPQGEACYCSQVPNDPYCQQQGGTDPNNPTPQPTGGDPCQTDPQGDACYCQQMPQDPYCQQGGDQGGEQPTGDPCQTDPYGDECYCQQVPDDPYCQQGQ